MCGPWRSRRHTANKPKLTEKEQKERLALFRRRREALAKAPFNRDMMRMITLIERLRTVLDRFTHYGPEVVLDAWAEAGLPEYDPDDADQELYVFAAETVPGDAMGFYWACNMFLGTLQTEVIEEGKRYRRRCRTRERNP